MDAPCLVGRARYDAALLAGVASFVWYALGAARALPFEDAGLLLSAAHVFGVPHPPGYPLWTILVGALARAFGLLGVDIVVVASLFSATCAAVAAAALATLARSRGASAAVAAATGALPLAATATFAAQAVTVEVYALLAACVAVTVALALAPIPRPRATAIAGGLAFAAHPAALFVVPTLVVVAALRARVRGWRGISLIVAAFVAPLALYLYVPLAAARDPLVNFGEATGGAALIDHLLRSQYGAAGSRTLAELADFLVSDGVPGPLTLVIVLFAGGRRAGPRRSAAIALAAVLVIGLALTPFVYVWPLGPENRARFAGSLVPLVVASLAVWATFIGSLERHAARWLGARGAATALVLALALVTAGSIVWPSERSALASDTRLARRAGAEPYARELLASLPPDAVLVVNKVGYTDILGFPLLFAQVARGVRPDVTVIDRGLLALDWYRSQLARRSPDLAPALRSFDAHVAQRPELLADTRSRRIAAAPVFEVLFAGPRPLAFTDLPGPAVLGTRELVPGALHLEWTSDPARRAALLAAPAPSREAETPDAGPWTSVFEEIAAERARLRAAINAR